MQFTRRAWALVGVAVGLAGWAIIVARPLVLSGTILVGSWLFARQYLFMQAMTALHADIEVTQTPATQTVQTGETIPMTLQVGLAQPTQLFCTVTASPPLATHGTAPGVTLGPDTQAATETASLGWPVAGRHEFSPAELTATDGLFRTTVTVGSTPTVTVRARGPRNLHVGEGGEQVATAYGEHDAGRAGTGLKPAELRQYQPGDAADRIDWNATARLNTPYVREFEAETDRTTLLIVDQRSSLATGPPAETKFAYLRELALTVVDSAAQLSDPLGVVGVGDEGQTQRITPSTKPDQYEQIRNWLRDLSPTAADPSIAVSSPQDTETTLAETRRAAATLAADDSPFAQTFQPFYADQRAYTTRIGDEPLYATAQAALGRQQGPVFTIICTDDTHRSEVLETAKLASRGQNQALVLLAPTVLYETGGLADLEDAYEQYVDFETFRRRLARMDRVTAYEVAPGQRLSAVLAAGRGRRQPSPRGRPQ